jgi:hypothetical protein
VSARVHIYKTSSEFCSALFAFRRFLPFKLCACYTNSHLFTSEISKERRTKQCSSLPRNHAKTLFHCFPISGPSFTKARVLVFCWDNKIREVRTYFLVPHLLVARPAQPNQIIRRLNLFQTNSVSESLVVFTCFAGDDRVNNSSHF